MSGNSAISMFAIFDYFKSNPKQLKKGELSFNAGYVCKIVYEPTTGLIQGEVKASMKSICILTPAPGTAGSSISLLTE